MILRAVILLAAFGALAVTAGVRFALLAGIGVAIGFSLERFGFGFAGPWRRLILNRQGDGVMAQLLAIGLTAVVIQPLIASAPGQLLGAIAPVSLSMVLAAFVFGLAMQWILGCGSGTLVNAGSGNLIALLALPFFCLGSFIGTLWVPAALAATPHTLVSLPAELGTTGSVLVTVALLLAVAGLVAWKSQGSLVNRNALWAAVILAALAIIHVVVAGQPWGVVYGLGLWVAKGAMALGWDPATAAFWTHPINQAALEQSILTDTTSLTSLGLVAGAALAAWKTAGATPLMPSVRPWVFLLVAFAGLLLGISSRLAFGCNVGALFSGIASGSLHGWFWLVAGFLGSVVGVYSREWIWARAARETV